MTAVVILDHDATDAEWLLYRRAGIGGSDIGALLGASPYTNSAQLWADKMGERSSVESDAMRVGSALEAGVIKLACDYLRQRDGKVWLDEAPPRLLRHPEHGVAQYSPDGFADTPEGTWLLEAKVTSKWLRKPQPHWVAQVQWGLGITGLERALITWVNGSRVQHTEIEADAAWFAQAVEYATRWWGDFILTATPTSDEAPDELTVFRSADPDLSVEVGADLVMRLEAARAAWKAADEVKRAVETEVKVALGNATAGLVDGVPRLTYKPSTRTSVDVQALKADGLYDKYAVTKPTAGTLTLLKPKEK